MRQTSRTAVVPDRATARSARQRVVVHPHWTDWLSLGLLPLPACYFAFIICYHIRGDLGDSRESLTLGAVLSIVTVALAVRAMLTRGYFTLDAIGLTIGRSASVRVHWEEVQAVFAGMPGKLPWAVTVFLWTPHARGNAKRIIEQRQSAVVLRLAGGRLLTLHLWSRNRVGGRELMTALVERYRTSLHSPADYTEAEARALAVLTAWNRIVEVT